jgi:hypothetical protein
MLSGKELKFEAERLLHNNDFSGSRALYSLLLKSPDFEAEAYFGLAALAFKSKDFDEAQRCLNECLTLVLDR